VSIEKGAHAIDESQVAMDIPEIFVQEVIVAGTTRIALTGSRSSLSATMRAIVPRRKD
jgi:hypothetical protein